MTLKTVSEAYKSEVKQLFTNNSDLAIELLDLTAGEKRSVMEKTLSSNAELPSDKEFIKIINKKAFDVLDKNYLRKDANGKYDQGYPIVPMQYDWSQGAKKITIPESIGLISELASGTKPNLDQMKELTATLFEKKDFMTKKEAHNAFKHFNVDGVNDYFKQASGLDIEEVYKEQQKFKLAKQLYVVATTYGDNSSACAQGTWV